MSPLMLGPPAWGTTAGMWGMSSCWLAEEMVPPWLPLRSLSWHSVNVQALAPWQQCSCSVPLLPCPPSPPPAHVSVPAHPAHPVGVNALFGSAHCDAVLAHALASRCFPHSSWSLTFSDFISFSNPVQQVEPSDAEGQASPLICIFLVANTAMCSIICLLTEWDLPSPLWFEHLFIFFF